MARAVTGLFAVAAVLTAAVSFAQTTQDSSGLQPSRQPLSFWNAGTMYPPPSIFNLLELRDGGWSADETDRSVTIRFVEPALVPNVPMSVESPESMRPLFQPGNWIDQQADDGRGEPNNPPAGTMYPWSAAGLNSAGGHHVLMVDGVVSLSVTAPGNGGRVLQVAGQEAASPAREKNSIQIKSTQGQAESEVIPLPPSAEELLGAPITSLTTDIRVKENPRLKDDLPPSEVPLKLKQRGEMSYVMHRFGSTPLCYAWDAPLTCNNPLYFEETNLERHGYSPRYLRTIQPLVSGAEFFATIPTLPYQVVALPPSECIYTLGEYRPGSCVPYQINYPPWSPVGGVVEAGTAVGLVFLIP
jgi:hypothetical protein